MTEQTTPPLILGTDEARRALEALEFGPPFLLETSFPRQGMAGDWFLAHSIEELESVLAPFGNGMHVHIRSVWNLVGEAYDLHLRKS